MKHITNNLLIVLSFLGIILLYSCNDKDNFYETDSDNIPKGLQIEIESKTKDDFPSTRVITDLDTINARKSYFEVGDAIGVFAVKAGSTISTTPTDNYINNGKLVFNGEKWVWQPELNPIFHQTKHLISIFMHITHIQEIKILQQTLCHLVRI